ncbi:MAG: hypothetical protein MJK14_10625, partial [Rivularia sp. ALOHA_DT_140]|nr:hypothetical protein [Rivularia sp. ALOHA_DT_140]
QIKTVFFPYSLLATCETVAVDGFPGISKLLNPKGYLLLPYPLKKLIQQALTIWRSPRVYLKTIAKNIMNI